MPTKVEWKKNGVEVTFEGDVTFDEYMKTNMSLMGSPQFDSLEYQLADLLLMNDMEVDSEMINIIGQLDINASHWTNQQKIAMITDNPKFVELSFAYKEIVDQIGWEVEVFNSKQDAYDWLGIL